MKLAALAMAVLLSSQSSLTEAPTGAGAIPIPPGTMVVDLEGRPTDLHGVILPVARDDNGGGATLLVFWASWCQPCIHEIPVLNEFHRFYGKRGLRVVSVGIKFGGGTLENLKEAAGQHEVTYPVFFDHEGTMEKAFGINALPTTVLIDGEGKVIWNGPSLPSNVDDLIKQAVAPGEDGGSK